MEIPSGPTYMYDDNILNPNKETEDGYTSSNIEDEELINNILLKTNKQGINRGWNNHNENLIVSIGENATSYKYMHEKSAEICMTINNTFKIILIVCSSLLTVMTSIPDSNFSSGFVITRYIFTYFVTLFSVLLHFLQYAYLSDKHNNAAAEFAIIYHDIQQQMCLYRRDRYIAFRYLSKTLKKYDSLIMMSPRINKFVFDNYKKRFANTNVNIPDIIKKIQKINIIHETHENDDNGTKSESSGGSSANDRQGVFCIRGDITDNDLENINAKHIKELRSRFFKENSTYEYMRFLHNEND